MTDKSSHSHSSKGSGKSIKEKRAAKKQARGTASADPVAAATKR